MSDPAAATAAPAKNGIVAIAVGLVAIGGAAMLAMMFFGIGTESIAQAFGNAGNYLSSLGSGTAALGAGVNVFFTLNRSMIYMAIGFAALISVLFLFKKLL